MRTVNRSRNVETYFETSSTRTAVYSWAFETFFKPHPPCRPSVSKNIFKLQNCTGQWGNRRELTVSCSITSKEKKGKQQKCCESRLFGRFPPQHGRTTISFVIQFDRTKRSNKSGMQFNKGTKIQSFCFFCLKGEFGTMSVWNRNNLR